VEVPTHVAAVLEHESGPVSTLVASFDVPATRYRFIEIYRTEATLAVPDPNTFGGPVQIRRNGDPDWSDVRAQHLWRLSYSARAVFASLDPDELADAKHELRGMIKAAWLLAGKS